MTRQKKKKAAEPWPPEWARLPDTLDEIEFGRRTQRELFSEVVVPDDSRSARLARLLADVPGVTTAANLKGVYPI